MNKENLIKKLCNRMKISYLDANQALAESNWDLAIAEEYVRRKTSIR